MKDKRVSVLVVLAAVAVITFAGDYAIHALGGAKVEGPSQADCGDRLRQSMDDMHRRMHAVKPSGDADEDFVRLMLPHHQAAVEMAKIELLCGKDGVNRRLAQEIIADQQSEIELMRLWLEKRSAPGQSVTPATEVKRP